MTTNRQRTVWLLVALVSIHTLVTTAIFLATGTLPNGLLVFTLVVFGVCALAALYFMTQPAARAKRYQRVEAANADDELVVTRVEVEQPKATAVAVD